MALETVTISVQELTPIGPLSGVKVTLYDRDTGALFGTATTDVDGLATFTGTVHPGDVGVLLEAPSHVPVLPEPYITVPNTNGVTPYVPPVIDMQDLGITPARSVKRCHLHGTIVDASGWGESSAVIVEVLGKGPQGFVRPSVPGSGDSIDPSSILVTGYKIQVPVNQASGYWGVDLPVGALVHLSIPSIRLSHRFLVPDQPKLHVKDIRPWLRGSSTGALVGD